MPKDESQREEALDAASVGAIADAVKAHEPDAERKEAMRSKIFARIHAPAPDGTRTLRAESQTWQTVDSFIEVKILRIDPERNSQTALWRLKPGAVILAHHHTQEEECLVLEGGISVGDYHVAAGDFHLAQPGYEHPRIESKLGALLLIRSEIVDRPSDRS